MYKNMFVLIYSAIIQIIGNFYLLYQSININEFILI